MAATCRASFIRRSRRRFEPGTRRPPRGDLGVSFLADVVARAAAVPRRIVFPEAADDRMQAAVAELARQRIVEPVVVLDPAAPDSHAAVRALGVETRDPATDDLLPEALERLLERRQSRGLTKDEAW